MLTPDLRRRSLLQGLALGSVAVPLGLADRLVAAPTRPEDVRFIARALELAGHGSARGDGTPFGALVVRDGTVVAEGWNRTRLLGDATAHAETEAIRAAARALGRRDLAGCTLYTNGGRPCPMCEGAAWFARIDRLVYAHSSGAINDAGEPQLGGC